MTTLKQYFYFYTFVVTCMSSENENVPPMSGFYTDGLDQALDKIEIVYPERVSKDGAFVSYYLPHYYNLESLENRPKRSDGSVDLSGDAIHFFVPIEGEKHHLELVPNLNFLAPGLVIERRDARDVDNINKAKISQISQKQCHYNGRIVGKPDSRAALSTCYGLAGSIQLPAGEEYLIEPVKDSKPAYNKEHPHIMYKRSGIKDRLANSNCLTKGSAKDALGERLQWESIFGSQVRKDFSALNMNDLVRENSVKVLKDTNTRESKDIDTANNIMDTISSASLPQERLSKTNERKFEEGNLNAINIKVTENSMPLNGNQVDGNVQSPSFPSHFENNKLVKYDKSKIDFGNKLKQKPLKEELGSIKLPDVNFSPLKSSPNQAIYVDNFNNKQVVPIFEKEKKFYDGDFEPKRIKREINLGIESIKSKEVSDIKRVADHQDSLNTGLKNEEYHNSGKGADTNSVEELEEMPDVKRFSLEVNHNGQQHFMARRQAQHLEEDSRVESKITGNNAWKTSKDKGSNVNEDLRDKNDHNNDNLNINNGDIKKEPINFNTKQDDLGNKKESLKNDQTFKSQSTGKQNQKILNNVKRDIHLDTSEKSWQSGEINGQLNFDEMQENTNSKDVDNAFSQTKLSDENLPKVKNLDSSLEGEFIKDSKSSKISKVKKINSHDNDDIMVSALESVAQDMDKSKVKKDVLGGYSHSQSESVIPAQPPSLQMYSKTPIKFDDAKYIRLDEVPVHSSADVGERVEIARTNEDGTKPSLDLVKNNGPALVAIEEPNQAVEIPNKNLVDEIVIKIKTPEGTISEVKQSPKTEGENLRISNNELVMNNQNTGARDSVLGLDRSQAQVKSNFKSIDKEKGKRDVNTKSQNEIKEKSNSKDAQEVNIVNESTHRKYGETISDTKNKVKRDDNTIHLVIETEPEVKSSENHNAESPGSNLFCQGRNCLEIKPIYLTENKSAVTSSASNIINVDSSKEKVVEKRDAKENGEFDESCGATSTPPPMKCHDFNNRIFTLELMITVDFKVVQMHEDDDIENFILTIINMVSSNFDDKSLGININVVLVRLILLTTCIKELDSDRFDPEELLENFCTWQVLVNPGRDDHPHHHDLAVFVSKMDKCEGKVMGVSYLTSVCRPDKACIICVDEGLLLANTITHQIGHSLGAEHDDGQHSACAPRLPDGTTYHMAPQISETSNSWSVCSRDAIFQFVQTQGSWCLIDFPVVRSYNFPLMLPGQIYSAAQQCRLNFHMTAIPCSVGPFCNKLYCQITDKLCATKGDPPADGTFCASNMWCFHKQCVHVGRRPGAINGEWGPWTEWSLCTRSCGGGVSSSYRICNNPRPENGGRFCIGERLRHRICQTTPCQGFTESFRDLQCKRTEDRPFRGKIHNWVQYQSLFVNIECALVCQNRKGDVVMRSPIVADGTPCKAGTQNVCIQGSCRSVGCDYVIDSNAKEDACGVCHGNGTECKIVQGVFEEPIAKKGLVEFLRIPKDSGMIFVREVSPSTNTIVVSGSINRVFYLNGLGAEDSMAGDVAFGVTHGVYEKRGGMERIFIRGPTKEDLIFYMLFRDRNRGVHYQYATLDYDPTYIPQYVWQYLDWDACSDPCSGGSQRARAKCVEDRGGVVDDKYCTQSTRPIDIIRPCNDFPCQAKWWVSVWSDCICTGATSVMFRSVLCMRANDESGTRVEVVKESECSLVKKPPTQKPCNYSDEDTDCAKRSIPDDAMFRAQRDLRRAVHPRLAFSQFSPDEAEGTVSQEMHLSQDQPFEDSNKESFHDLRFLKKSKVQNKNTNNKGSGVKVAKSKTDGKGLISKKEDSIESLKDTDNLKPVDLSKNEDNAGQLETKSDVLPLLNSKGRQDAKIIQKDNAGFENGLTPAIANNPAADDDLMMKENEVKGVTCESTEESSICPTEENTSETPTTCKNTCAPQPHKKTTCCKTTPHRQYVIKTTMETTTIRPVAVKMDELNVNNFALTVVPLEITNKKKLLPQSDPEFINLGAVGQFGVADEFNATVITGQEALDLLEFARSNASEEPVILHEDMHN